MKNLNVTLLFNGTTETAFNFYRSVFGGEFTALQRMKDIPAPPEAPEMSAEDKEKILFIALPVAKATISGMDMPPHMEQAVPGSNFMVSLDMDSEEETTRVFNGLAEGGEVKFPLGPQFWATYFGMVTDKFGITWMLNYNQ